MRLIFFIVFFLGFIIFGLIKSIGQATKSAYNAVFNPNSESPRVFRSPVYLSQAIA